MTLFVSHYVYLVSFELIQEISVTRTINILILAVPIPNEKKKLT